MSTSTTSSSRLTSSSTAAPSESDAVASVTALALPPVTISEMGGVRYLHLGTTWVQGAMRLARPLDIELDYVRRMMVWMLLRPESGDAAREAWDNTHTVQLGLGSGTITRFCHRVLGAHATAVELNPEVIRACEALFYVPRSAPRLQVLHRDAAEYVADPKHRDSADAVCVDVYDHEVAGPVLDSAAFYRGCYSLLRPGGVMTVNLFGHGADLEGSRSRVAQAFGEAQLFHTTPGKNGHIVLGAVKQHPWPDADTLRARAKNIETQFQLPALEWLDILRR
ncbi:MAG: methyltransferase domain-containing protein [Pseudomonadota bacterium]